MFRYVAFLWNAGDSASAESAKRLAARLRAKSSAWCTALNRPGLWVLYADARPKANAAYLLADNEGVILGKLFRRNDDCEMPSHVGALDRAASGDVVRSGGRYLVEKCWGRYVAFVRNPSTGDIRVLRSPLGTLPCFCTSHKQVKLYFSFMEDVLDLGLPGFSVNWSYIAAKLAAYAIECRETALNEVEQVLAGECLEISDGASTSTTLWNPHQIACTQVVEDQTVAAAALRGSVRTCVKSWASCYEHSLVRLSGGLDSSIIASCLPNEPQAPGITCVNYFSSGPDTDERDYARLAAAAAGRELVEHERSAEFRLEGVLEVARTPKPTFYLEYLENSRLEADIARTHGATAIMTGSGGDQIFYHNPAVWPVVDFARRNGLRWSLATAALDAARLAGVSVWTALGVALRDQLVRPAPDLQAELGEHQTLVRREIVDWARHESRFVHPALQNVEGTPPGKLRQLRAFLYSIEYYDPLGLHDDPEHVHPLLSQPLIELCLRIPTYVLTSGGWDRALARKAFAEDLPRQVVRRRSKGSVGDHYKAILLRNLPFVRALLVDGALVGQGLLDRKKLEEVLSGRPTKIASSPSEVHTYVGIEAWLRRWSGARQQAVA